MRRLFRETKTAVLHAARSVGAFNIVRDSHWRQQRLLILAYHGVAIDDEDRWRPDLYMSAEFFESRLKTLQAGGYTVLRLQDALAALRAGTLPPRSVTLTFDDGNYDFYCRVFPLLSAYGFPATVYLTTYYSEYNKPIFDLVCSYLLWKRSERTPHDTTVDLGSLIGTTRKFGIASEEQRRAAVRSIVMFTRTERLTSRDKDDLARRLAALLGVDYDALCEKRILHLLNSTEVQELADRKVDFGLHTHRHNCPHDRDRFAEEVRENRTRVERLTQTKASHFCYPSGRYQPYFLPWLESEHIESATTCDPGLVAPDTSALLLPRFIDTQHVPEVRFEAWLSGTAAWVPGHRTAEHYQRR